LFLNTVVFPCIGGRKQETLVKNTQVKIQKILKNLTNFLQAQRPAHNNPITGHPAAANP